MNLPAWVLRAARSAAALGIVLSAASAAVPASAAQAAATSAVGWLRLAHLSPNTPAVDVYLYSAGNPVAVIVLKHVAYGTESPYEQVPAGNYTVAMRGAGAAPGSKPVLSTLVDVGAGHAYTVAGMGPFKALRLQVLPDRLSAPTGKSLVRVIAASLQDKRVDVRLGGQTIARQLAFGTATSYLTVPPGTAMVHVTGGSSAASRQLSLAADSIHTLVVLDDPGHLTIQVLEDAAGSASIPAGAAGTGLGGTAARAGSPPLSWLGAALLGLLLAGASAVRMRAQRAGAHARAQ